jgi:putative methionine-R-sulfoxide reductase with GAF domain
VTPPTDGGRYEILTPISSGAMGAVFKALDHETGEEVALKRLLDPRQAARFEIEARLLASLRHPRVVRVTDHAQDDEGLFIVMELVRGTDLGAVLTARGDPGLPVADAVDYARQTCEALLYVHEQQIVHRDVKPQNMILAEEAGVVLVDFGVARELGGIEDAGTIAVGTPRYMAPEVFAGGTVSAASDIFSLAATLWTLLIGTPPRYGDTLRIDKLAPGLPPELREALVGGLEMLPEQRVGSAAAFAEAIGAPLTGHRGESLAQSLGRVPASSALIEAIVRTAAGVFEAAAASIALTDHAGELVYEAAWGAGAAEVVGLRLPRGAGLAGAVVTSGEGVAVPDCRSDPRFASRVAARTGYVPYTMVVTPLIRDGRPIGVLSLLDKRDGKPYLQDDLARAALFADLAVVSLDLDSYPQTSFGGTRHLPVE